MTTSVQISNLHKTFGKTTALNGINLDVESGSTLALLGPSGCGKTTLLRSIAGLEHPDSGKIQIGTKAVFDDKTFIKPVDRCIGMVFQDWALFPHMSVEANVGYGLSKSERSSGRVRELLTLVGLDDLGQRMPHQLSGGQQQRVALARALARKPPVLLFDEPFSNLDAELRTQIRAEVCELLYELKITSIFVTHDQEEAFVVGDSVALMHSGKIIQHAKPRDLYDNPASQWVAQFVGDANLITGTATGSTAQTFVGQVPLKNASNGQVQILVRPESLKLSSGDTGEVKIVEYYGHDVMHRVALKDGTEIAVRTHPSDAFEHGALVDFRYDGSPTSSWIVEATI